MKTLRLRPGKERSLLRRHPWIFESAIAKGGGDSGETVRVESHEGQFLAWAAFSPSSRIRARVWSFDEAQRIDAPFFIAACARSISARARFDVQSDGVRLVHGESDGLPGLIVDRYGDTLVAQFTSAGTERWKGVIADALLRETGLTKLYERSDASVRSLEGLEPATGWLRGGPSGAAGDGEGPPLELTIREHQWRLTLNIAEATRPASIWTSATAASGLPTTPSAWASSMCSTAFATPVASVWRRWRACVRQATWPMGT